MSVSFLPSISLLQRHHLLKLFEEPRVDLRQAMDFIDRIAVLQGISDVRKPLRIRAGQLSLQFMIGNALQAQRLYSFQRAQTL